MTVANFKVKNDDGSKFVIPIESVLYLYTSVQNKSYITLKNGTKIDLDDKAAASLSKALYES